MVDLGGKRALVCGSSRGIGRACAQLLAERGAQIVLFARDEGALDAVRAALPPPASGAHASLVADFDHPTQVATALAPLLKQRDAAPIHILVNNSGGPPGGPITDADPQAFRVAFNRHVLASQVITQALLPGMRAAGYGRIVNIISTSVKQPLPGLGVSNTIRAAVANWAKTLAGEVAAAGITVNNVLPGATETARLREIALAKANRAGRDVESVEAAMRTRIPAGRFAKPAEIAAAVAFLCSPEAAYITGINLPVDGGRTGCL